MWLCSRELAYYKSALDSIPSSVKQNRQKAPRHKTIPKDLSKNINCSLRHKCGAVKRIGLFCFNCPTGNRVRMVLNHLSKVCFNLRKTNWRKSYSSQTIHYSKPLWDVRSGQMQLTPVGDHMPQAPPPGSTAERQAPRSTEAEHFPSGEVAPTLLFF